MIDKGFMTVEEADEAFASWEVVLNNATIGLSCGPMLREQILAHQRQTLALYSLHGIDFIFNLLKRLSDRYSLTKRQNLIHLLPNLLTQMLKPGPSPTGTIALLHRVLFPKDFAIRLITNDPMHSTQTFVGLTLMPVCR